MSDGQNDLRRERLRNGHWNSCAQEHVRVARCLSMGNDLRIRHLCPNDLEQPCGLRRWQDVIRVADFNEPHRVHAGVIKSLLPPPSYGEKSSVGVSPESLCPL